MQIVKHEMRWTILWFKMIYQMKEGVEGLTEKKCGGAFFVHTRSAYQTHSPILDSTNIRNSRPTHFQGYTQFFAFKWHAGVQQNGNDIICYDLLCIAAPAWQHSRTYVMSLCKITGLFCIAGGLWIALYPHHPYVSDGALTPSTTGSNETLYQFAHYNSTISSTRRPITFADIHVPEPINNDILSRKSVAFVISSVFLQTGVQLSIIDTTYLQVFPWDPVQEDSSKRFTLKISQFIQECLKQFKLATVSDISLPLLTLTCLPVAYWLMIILFGTTLSCMKKGCLFM